MPPEQESLYERIVSTRRRPAPPAPLQHRPGRLLAPLQRVHSPTRDSSLLSRSRSYLASGKSLSSLLQLLAVHPPPPLLLVVPLIQQRRHRIVTRSKTQ